MGISVRNVGSGVAVLHGWRIHADPLEGSEASGSHTRTAVIWRASPGRHWNVDRDDPVNGHRGV